MHRRFRRRRLQASSAVAGEGEDRRIVLWTLRAFYHLGLVKREDDWRPGLLEAAGIPELAGEDCAEDPKARLRLVRERLAELEALEGQALEAERAAAAAESEVSGGRRRRPDTALRGREGLADRAGDPSGAPAGGAGTRATVLENADRLGRLLGLDEAATEVLAFCVLLGCHEGLSVCFAGLGRQPRRFLLGLIARVLQRPEREVRDALAPRAPLQASGLVRVGPAPEPWDDGVVTLGDGLLRAMLQDHADDEALLACFLPLSTGTTLGPADFDYLRAELSLLGRLLGGALARTNRHDERAATGGSPAARRRRGARSGADRPGRGRGVNVLIHGPPGVGKTELVRVLAGAIGASLYEVRVADDDGDALTASQRLLSFGVAQRLIGRREPALLLFDEVEEIFGGLELGEGLAFFRPRAAGKGFLNRLLEENPVPTLWVANSIASWDLATLRRFDYVLPLGPPPAAARLRMVRASCRGLGLPARFVARLAAATELTAADLESARRVAQLSGAGRGRAAEETFARVLGSRLGARQQSVELGGAAELPRLDFDPTLLGTDVGIDALLAGLRRRGEGRLCFHGPPGTGKTAFARYLAGQLDRPLLVKRASELLNKYVGESERNLAAMFGEARAQGAVLLLDEADSFLQDRGRAERSWEVTQVNELLVQMEAFRGVFICATNLPDTLDRAAFRRFDLKVRFDYPGAGQRRGLFTALARTSGALRSGEAVPRAVLARLDQLERLGPGDFATVLRRRALLGDGARPTLGELLEGLEAEVGYQPDRRRPVGFGRG